MLLESGLRIRSRIVRQGSDSCSRVSMLSYMKFISRLSTDSVLLKDCWTWILEELRTEERFRLRASRLRSFSIEWLIIVNEFIKWLS